MLCCAVLNCVCLSEGLGAHVQYSVTHVTLYIHCTCNGVHGHALRHPYTCFVVWASLVWWVEPGNEDLITFCKTVASWTLIHTPACWFNPPSQFSRLGTQVTYSFICTVRVWCVGSGFPSFLLFLYDYVQ